MPDSQGIAVIVPRALSVGRDLRPFGAVSVGEGSRAFPSLTDQLDQIAVLARPVWDEEQVQQRGDLSEQEPEREQKNVQRPLPRGSRARRGDATLSSARSHTMALSTAVARDAIVLRSAR